MIDLVGPEKIPFKKFLENSNDSNVSLENISLKKAKTSALTIKDFPYGIEDINILSGNFQGNHRKLEKLTGLKFTKIRRI